MNAVLKYPGAKNRLAHWICGHMPKHNVYLEPYAGSLAVLLNKTPCHIETVNDLSGEVVNYFRVLRDCGEELQSLIKLTPYSRLEYDRAYEKADNDIERALLILPIKKKWFDMELSGEKPEEYREIKPYWTSRILKWLGYPKSEEKAVMQMLREQGTLKQREVLFRNGYSSKSPSFTAMCTLKIGGGYEEWGAVKGEEYFVFTIHEIRN